jgi:hypothetical protein
VASKAKRQCAGTRGLDPQSSARTVAASHGHGRQPARDFAMADWPALSRARVFGETSPAVTEEVARRKLESGEDNVTSTWSLPNDLGRLLGEKSTFG